MEKCYERDEEKSSQNLMKVFLAAPFSNEIMDTTGKVRPVFRKTLEKIISFIRSKGYEVISSHERESWGERLMPPEEFTTLDFASIKNCDIIVVYINEKLSGVYIELGWASSLKKRIVILAKHYLPLPPLLLGLHMLTDVTLVRFDNENELLAKLSVLL